MAYDFKLPDIGEGVVEGEIVRWLVKEGDDVRPDQPMVEIMTDKATVEIPAPRGGRVLKRMYEEGQLCPVGRVLISIDDSGEKDKTPAPMLADRSGARPAQTSPRAPAATPASASAGSSATVLATPATRKLARDLGVDIGIVTGSGPNGRITSDDVRTAKSGGPNGAPAGRGATVTMPFPPQSAPGDVRIPFRGLRRKIAEHMARAKDEVAHFTYVDEVDCTQLVELREKANERLRVKISYLPFIVRATIDALKKYPQLNATLDEKAGEIVQRREYHIGMATQTEDGLVVPVLRHADRRSIIENGREIERLASAARAGKATREELTGSTFTITSLGLLGGVLATPIVNYPEVAIMGVHKIVRRPVVFEDKIVIRHMMNLSLSVDHRLVDGFDAARFIAQIKESLESPGLLFLESV